MREQPADGRVRVGRRGGPQGVAHLAERRPGGQRVEHLPAARVDLRQQGGKPGGVGEQLDDAVDPGARGQAERLARGGDLPVRSPRQARRDRAAQPGRRRPRDLADRGQQVQRVVRAPYQRQVAQPVDRAGQRGRREGRAGQRLHRARAGRVVEEHQRVDHGERRRVQLLERPQHGQAYAGPRRQHAEVGRHRYGQVGTASQQRGEPVVGPRPEPVGQAPRGGVHRTRG